MPFQPTDENDDDDDNDFMTLTGIDVTDNDQRNMNLFLSHGCRLVDDDDDVYIEDGEKKSRNNERCVWVQRNDNNFEVTRESKAWVIE